MFRTPSQVELIFAQKHDGEDAHGPVGIGGVFGAFVAAFLAIPSAGAIQVMIREVWNTTAQPHLAEATASGQGPAAHP